MIHSEHEELFKQLKEQMRNIVMWSSTSYCASRILHSNERWNPLLVCDRH